MYRSVIATVALLMILALDGTAELQELRVGGSIDIEGDYYARLLEQGSTLRIGAGPLWKRPVGSQGGVFSDFSFAKKQGWSAITQRTTVHVDALFSEGVRAYIELDSMDHWGEDFRSAYVTGLDQRAATSDDVEVYQAFLELDEVGGAPLWLRVGRQELVFGSSWLLGNNTFAPAPFAWGLSYDALRAAYHWESLRVDGFAAKLSEGFESFGAGDVDFYGLYGSCTAMEALTLDAYWLYLRDDRDLFDTQGRWDVEWIESVLGLDQYETTQLHTLGLRGAGAWQALDYELEAAYQFGDADQVGSQFTWLGYGDTDAEYDNWAATLTAGYRFDVVWQPRLYAGFAYFQGEDNRDIGFLEWLNPFYQPQASVSFNRLFSDICYSLLLDASELSNYRTFFGGIQVAPTEKIAVELKASQHHADAPFARPRTLFFSFLDQESDDDMGWELALTGSYAYSEDLEVGAGWAHFFTASGAYDGNFIAANGLGFIGGRDDKDADYLYCYSSLSF